MFYKIIVPFSLSSGYSYETTEEKTEVKIVKIEPSTIEILIQNYKFSVQFDGKLQGNIISLDCIPKHKIQEFLELLKIYITFLLEKDNKNKLYKTYFLNIHLFNLKRKLCSHKDNSNIDKNLLIKDKIYLDDKVNCEIFRQIKLNEQYNLNNLSSESWQTFLLESYYNAIRTPIESLKFLSLFTIIEFLENSEDYKRFIKQLLEKGEIKYRFSRGEISEGCQRLSTEKKNFLKQFEENIRYTNVNRSFKLYKYLESFLNTEPFWKNLSFSVEDIENILNLRHKIVHSVQARDKKLSSILYFKLFPLCEGILQKLILAK